MPASDSHSEGQLPESSHVLRCWPEHFQQVWNGYKRAEVRSTRDRNFQVGDKIQLCEFNPEPESYTGAEIGVTITHILRGPGYGIGDGYAVLSINPEVYVNA